MNVYIKITTLFACGLATPPGIDDPADPTPSAEPRRTVPNESPESASLRDALERMVGYLDYSEAEIVAATGRARSEIAQALADFRIDENRNLPRSDQGRTILFPYPGGRHPRLGFRDGAIAPKRQTKAVVVPPWEESGYAVIDLPEAIWADGRLIFLAHTHLPTLWTEQGLTLELSEWSVEADGALCNRVGLPNGVAYEATLTPIQQGVRMELLIENASDQPMDDLHAQVCVLLRGFPEFQARFEDQTLFEAPWSMVRLPETDRWLVTAWEPCRRSWGNPPCPCLHSDPRFEPAPPGATVAARGWLGFVEAGSPEEARRRFEAFREQAVQQATTP